MKTRLLSVLCILLMSLGIQAHNLEPLHVDGRYLKNSKGDIVTLHGYMTDLDSYFQVEEYRQGYDFLDHFQLKQVEGTSIGNKTNPVGRDSKTVLKKCYPPGEQYNKDQRPAG